MILGAGAGFGWNAYQAHHRADVRHAIKQTEALLQNANIGGMKIDRSGTACHGIGDLCVQSQSTPIAALTQLTAQLRGLGLDLGAPTCKMNPDLVEIYGAGCLATGSHRGAQIWAVAARHDGPFWANPVWLAVVVRDPDYQPALTSPTVPHPTAAQVLPRSWKLTRHCGADAGQDCRQFSVLAHGTANQVAQAAARQLEQEGFGVGTRFDRKSMCWSVNGTSRCVFSGEKYLTPQANLVVVTVLLQQHGRNIVTGRTGIS